MNSQLIKYDVGSISNSVKVFILGMLVAFIISTVIAYNDGINLSFETPVVDCNNPKSVAKARDLSRNGIANGCS